MKCSCGLEMTRHPINPNMYHCLPCISSAGLSKPHEPAVELSWVCENCNEVEVKPGEKLCDRCFEAWMKCDEEENG
jgi:hypothetical protein